MYVYYILFNHLGVCITVTKSAVVFLIAFSTLVFYLLLFHWQEMSFQTIVL